MWLQRQNCQSKQSNVGERCNMTEEDRMRENEIAENWPEERKLETESERPFNDEQQYRREGRDVLIHWARPKKKDSTTGGVREDLVKENTVPPSDMPSPVQYARLEAQTRGR